MTLEQYEASCEVVRKYQQNLLKELNELMSDDEMTIWDREYMNVVLYQMQNANIAILHTKQIMKDMVIKSV